MAMTYWVNDCFDKYEVPVNAENPLQFEETIDHFTAQELRSSSSSSSTRTISLSLQAIDNKLYGPLKYIPLEGTGSKIFILDHSNSDSNSNSNSNQKNNKEILSCQSGIFNILKSKAQDIFYVVAEKTSKSGVKMLNIRSSMKISNNSPIGFRIVLKIKDEIYWDEILQPSSEIYLPAQYCHTKSSKLLFQPFLSEQANAKQPFPTIEVPLPDIPGLHNNNNNNNNNNNSPVSVKPVTAAAAAAAATGLKLSPSPTTAADTLMVNSTDGGDSPSEEKDAMNLPNDFEWRYI
jgi:hypothetical protein